MPTAIQTLKWRGFGFDRGDGFFEIRMGLLGFAFLRQDVWVSLRAERESFEVLARENERLRAELDKTSDKLRAVIIAASPSTRITWGGGE